MLISQIMTTIQGEGPSIGIPSLFIRVGGCNLKCPFCDTDWALKSTETIKSFDSSQYIDKNYSAGEITKVKTDIELNDFANYVVTFAQKFPKINHIVLTGGEPLLYAESLTKLLQLILSKSQQFKTVDIETNGLLSSNGCRTLFSDEYGLYNLLSFRFIISPKLNHLCFPSKEISTYSDVKREYNKELMNFTNLKNMINQNSNTYLDWVYKFIYNKSEEKELIDFIGEGKTNIMIMPFTPKYKDFQNITDFYNSFKENCKYTIDFCIRNGFIFSPREHIWLYNDEKSEYSGELNHG